MYNILYCHEYNVQYERLGFPYQRVAEGNVSLVGT